MEKSALMYDLRRILQTRDEIAARYPADEHNRTQLAALRQVRRRRPHRRVAWPTLTDSTGQLEQLVATQQLTLLQVDDIRQQLQTMKLPTPPPEAPVFDVMNPSNIAALGQLIHDNPTVLQDAVHGHQQQQHERDAPTDSNVFGAIHEALAGALANPESAQATADAVAAQPALLQSLIEQHLFSADQLKGALAFLNSGPGTPAAAAPEVPEDPFVAEYEKMLDSFDVVLKPGSMLKPRPDLCEALYGKIPRAVRQDGARFLEGPTGDKRQAAHLDHLFRLDRSVRAGAAGREQGRMWATLEADWIVSKDFLPDDETLDKAGGEGEGKAEEAMEKIDPEKATLPRPADPKLAAAVCPVCKDVFETRFDDDDGDFFWINAVEVDGKPWHALCRAEFLASSAKAAKRSAGAAKGDGSRAASRDVTPGLGNGAQAGRSTPSLREKVLGKRKSATPDAEDATKRVKAEPA